MFKPVSPKVDFPKLEEKILRFWQEKKIFEKSLEKRKAGKKFTFYDGPPFATGLPHYGHILAMTIKDAVTRYKTMLGFFVPRRLGWDCHGLPVEYEVEKELKISGKKQIEEMGIEKFCQECRKIVFRYTKEWGKTIDRMGRWADKKNTYATLDLSYMESIWWVFRQIWDKGLIYQGFKSMPYCPRCGTPLSNFETNQGYQDNVPDPSIYVKFELTAQPGVYLLAWTTTPWTLPGNVALAVNPKIEYVEVETQDRQHFILAREKVAALGIKGKVIKKVVVQDLVGKTYKPLYEFVPSEKDKKSYLILAADFVTLEEGTGIVHIAPAFGEDDLNLALKENLQIIKNVNERGEFTKEVLPWSGMFVKEADKKIIADLQKCQRLFKEEIIYHTYPFCWRCETSLIYYAISTWFIKVSKLRQELVKNNEQIHWMPEHIKRGRFGKWLSEARDWAISRNRYWGTPIPLWQCGKCQKYTCVGSLAELEQRKIGKIKIADIHRPYIDEVKIRCDCGGQARRVPEVLDCWFESGAMPYAQDHYPFENKKDFEENFPADFIGEGLDQTRGWFYTLHVLATILFDKPAFKNCIVNGIVLDPEGKKLSKRLRNYPEPEEVFGKYGADSLRFLLLSSPAALAEELRISDEIIAQMRKVFLIFWNVYNFFVTYAKVDKWKIENGKWKLDNILDRWIISRLNQLVFQVTKMVDDYNLPKPLNVLSDFIINDLSTWYVRRSRDRVGPTVEGNPDKNACYATLHQVLVTLAKLLAPFTPFLAEEIYQNLTNNESVHLEDWPKADKTCIDELIHQDMVAVRKICELGHSERKRSGIKVRQPLQQFSIFTFRQKTCSKQAFQFSIDDGLIKLIKDELNVKEVKFFKGKGEIKGELDTRLTPELRAEGQARELVRQIQELRKKAGYALDQKIIVFTPSWPKEFTEYIKRETLAQKILWGKDLRISTS